jgi:hypothetical protein
MDDAQLPLALLVTCLVSASLFVLAVVRAAGLARCRAAAWLERAGAALPGACSGLALEGAACRGWGERAREAAAAAWGAEAPSSDELA